MSADVDVLICGAGPTGLVLAIDLARRGVSVRLIDKADAPFAGSRGKGLQPRSLEVFEDLGVIDRFLELGEYYPVERIHGPEGVVHRALVEDAAPTPDRPFKAPLMMPQFVTEGILRNRLATFGISPEYGCALVGFEQAEAGVTAIILTTGGERQPVRALYMVGADGGHSVVRHALNIGFPGESQGVRAIVADVYVAGLSRDAWHRWKPSLMGQIALCPLAGTDLFQLQGPIPAEGEPDLTADGLTKMLAERTGRDDLIVSRVNWASAYAMSARLADHYRVGRVFLAGDAAHIHPPTGGQGLNTSIQDAYNLGWKLAAVLAGAPDDLLDSYEAERRPVAASVLGLSVGLLDDVKQGQETRRGRETQQLDIAYPGSPLNVRPAAGSGVLTPGKRAPDAPCADAEGRPTRLFLRYQGPQWTLLGYEAGVAPPLEAGLLLQILRVGKGGALADDAGHIGRAYGLSPGDWVLIRPDGHVAAIVDKSRTEDLRSASAALGLAPSSKATRDEGGRPVWP